MRLMAVCYGFGKLLGGCGGCCFAVCCLLFAVCCQLFASCMPAAVGRKIKYRFHAWQAPEVFSKRQPLIFSHYLFFSSRLCGIYEMCVPHQYSCLRPSGRCRVKRPFSTTFSNSLWADLPQVSLSPALPGNPIRKVQAKVPFTRHLLERSVRPSTHLRKVSRKSGKSTHLRKVEMVRGGKELLIRRGRS